MNNKEQALQVIKVAIDEAIKRGVFPNMETMQQIIMSFTIIQTELKKTDSE